MTDEILTPVSELPPPTRGSIDMTALLHAAELLRLEEEGTLDPKTLASYGLDREKFYGCVGPRVDRPRSVTESEVTNYISKRVDDGVSSVEGAYYKNTLSNVNGAIPNSSNNGQYAANGVKTKKRSIKNREMHNLLEKNRRAHLKGCFDDLRDAIPGLEDGKQSTVLIIEKASKHIVGLTAKYKQQMIEVNRLLQLNAWCAEKLVELGGMDGDEYASITYECTRTISSPDSEPASTPGSFQSDSVLRQRSQSESSQSVPRQVPQTLLAGIANVVPVPVQNSGYKSALVIPTT
eukprot:CFRG6773T1